MARSPHVPKFGNWDADNVPYTAFFENARKEKSGAGVRINPNDPEQNPDAFNAANLLSSDQRTHSAAAASDVASAVNPGHNRKKSRRSKFTNDGHVPPSPDDYSGRSVSVPKFGAWDENDPRSAEGFTVIFNKVKEEKHTASAKLPAVPPPLKTNGGYDDQNNKSRSRRCCGCFF
ncbi:RPM1-interacting protein 4-like isoform X2 [Andrographis paniculata]|uniref:RPM1-interacting protein 4-like isoform X2 n=1 Tax=Andrographis paniculata TaxID=175694 RepID=UPI0021E99354|nr:RPM1-interacting protein 4-like isoform X2 [Andrographis paniculata]